MKRFYPILEWTPEKAVDGVKIHGIDSTTLIVRRGTVEGKGLFHELASEFCTGPISVQPQVLDPMEGIISRLIHTNKRQLIIVEATRRRMPTTGIDAFDSCINNPRRVGLGGAIPMIKERVIPVLVVDKNNSHTVNASTGARDKESAPRELLDAASLRRLIVIATTQETLREDVRRALSYITRGIMPSNICAQ